MALDPHEFARSYTAAWCSRDPTRVAAHFAPDGTIAINGGEPAEMLGVARAFIDAFPDMLVFMDGLEVGDEAVSYSWTFTGTAAETGNPVRVSGTEEWWFADDGLVLRSLGTYDQADYDRQVAGG